MVHPSSLAACVYLGACPLDPHSFASLLSLLGHFREYACLAVDDMSIKAIGYVRLLFAS